MQATVEKQIFFAKDRWLKLKVNRLFAILEGFNES
jgi:hypothetical protein